MGDVFNMVSCGASSERASFELASVVFLPFRMPFVCIDEELDEERTLEAGEKEAAAADNETKRQRRRLMGPRDQRPISRPRIGTAGGRRPSNGCWRCSETESRDVEQARSCAFFGANPKGSPKHRPGREVYNSHTSKPAQRMAKMQQIGRRRDGRQASRRRGISGAWRCGICTAGCGGYSA